MTDKNVFWKKLVKSKPSLDVDVGQTWVDEIDPSWVLKPSPHLASATQAGVPKFFKIREAKRVTTILYEHTGLLKPTDFCLVIDKTEIMSEPTFEDLKF